MKIAVVHGLLEGGAARRLRGTVRALAADGTVELREFTIAGTVTVCPDAVVRRDWVPVAARRSRWLRPTYRYVDHVRGARAWAAVWDDVNAWAPDAVFMNPAAVPGGTPPGAGRAVAPIVYYCDEPRRIDYEKDAARSTNLATRGLYWPMRRAQKAADRASVAAARTLLTNSAYTGEQIAAAYGRETEVVSPGIAPVFDRTDAPAAAPAHVLSVGTLIPSKGHDLVVRAVAGAAVDLPVVVVGPRDNADETARLRTLAADLGVRLEVRVGVTDDELVALYRSALVTMYLARDEPLGLVSLESQACGTPVIVADEGGLRHTVEPGVTGFRVPRDAASATAALRTLADPDRWPLLAAAAAARSIPREADGARQVLAALSAP